MLSRRDVHAGQYKQYILMIRAAIPAIRQHTNARRAQSITQSSILITAGVIYAHPHPARTAITPKRKVLAMLLGSGQSTMEVLGHPFILVKGISNGWYVHSQVAYLDMTITTFLLTTVLRALPLISV